MKSLFSDNIRALRKQQGLTQEQLAEAMGVTVGAVYKWEQDLSTPDIRIIMELAHFFGMSVDALIGYEVQNGTAEAYAKRIEELRQKKDYAEAVREAEQALVRYPNCFSIVYNCGKLYKVKGLENPSVNNESDMERAVAFFQKAELLLSQNSDPKVNAFTIETEIAWCRIAQGKKEEALEILKKTNVYGVHDAKIGRLYAMDQDYPIEKAAPFLTDALLNGISMQIDIMMGYLNYYERKGEHEAELEVDRWILRYLKSQRPDEGVSYVDKIIAPFCSEQARLLELLGRREEAEKAMQEAFRVAVSYDAAPTCNTSSLRYCIDQTANATIYDDVGPTAMFAVEEQMERECFSDALRTIWERLKAEI